MGDSSAWLVKRVAQWSRGHDGVSLNPFVSLFSSRSLFSFFAKIVCLALFLYFPTCLSFLPSPRSLCTLLASLLVCFIPPPPPPPFSFFFSPPPLFLFLIYLFPIIPASSFSSYYSSIFLCSPLPILPSFAPPVRPFVFPPLLHYISLWALMYFIMSICLPFSASAPPSCFLHVLLSPSPWCALPCLH